MANSLSTSSSDPRSTAAIVGRLFLFASPFLLWFVIEALVLPPHFFTFRVWEALKVYRLNMVLPGPFYPDQRVVMTEIGDLAVHSRFGIKKRVVWQTDEFGYRRGPSALPLSVVIVGDSNIVGSGVTQSDTVAEIMEHGFGIGAYPLAPADLGSFLSDQRFKDGPPQSVVLAVLERYADKLPAVDENVFRVRASALRPLTPLWVALDRVLKFSAVRWLNARVNDVFLEPQVRGRGDELMLFISFPGANESSRAELDRIISTLVSYKSAVEKRGLQFVWAAIPDKETIYYDYFPGSAEPTFFKSLVAQAVARGIKTVNPAPEMRRRFVEQKIILYQRDDTHLNPDGMRLMASLIGKAVQESAP